MLQIETPILNFFLLVLRISLNLSSDTSHEESRFSKVFLEKSFKFVSNKRDGTIAFNMDLTLLPAEVDLIL